MNKLVKGFLGTNNIDTNSRLCMSSAVAGYANMLGEDAVPVAYEDIELADCFLIAGANPAWCHPILFRRIEAHKQRNPDVKLIVVDPRKTQTCTGADLHLQPLPGTDIYLYNAIARVLIENGDVDYTFIHNHTEDYERYRESVFAVSLADAARVCDVPEEDIRTGGSLYRGCQRISDALGHGVEPKCDWRTQEFCADQLEPDYRPHRQARLRTVFTHGSTQRHGWTRSRRPGHDAGGAPQLTKSSTPTRGGRFLGCADDRREARA